MEELNSNINQTNGGDKSNEVFPPPPDCIEYKNGNIYIGETLNGTTPHGRGRVYNNKNQLVMDCEWNNGNPVLEPLRFKYTP
jgi:hypothetical protein